MAAKLKKIQYEAARLLAEGEMACDITKKLKLRQGTLRRWQRIPSFYDAVINYASEYEQALQFKLRKMRYTSASKLVYNVEHGYRNNPQEMVQMIKTLLLKKDDVVIESRKTFETPPGAIDIVLGVCEDEITRQEKEFKQEMAARKQAQHVAQGSEARLNGSETRVQRSEVVSNRNENAPNGSEQKPTASQVFII